MPIYEWFVSQLTPKVELKPNGRPLYFTWASGSGAVTVSMLKIDYDKQYASLLIRSPEQFDAAKRLQRNGLTRREAEVLFRLTRGETDKEIAQVLGMRPTTARTHVERIRFKLQVRTRTAAAIIAQAWLRGSDQT